MHAIPQLVSAPLNPIPIAEHFRGSHPPCEHSRRHHIQVRKITQSKTKTLLMHAGYSFLIYSIVMRKIVAYVCWKEVLVVLDLKDNTIIHIIPTGKMNLSQIVR